ncbi:MAG: type II toxin-antitoxin system YoeB family toxin [Puniceicoccales bacterium]|jgi:Txe/YoeB family toxin of Txe-Axe toxin-antitoxin module|nr:type II toxin-antitoxin system YoeB family toxin [Puniceicoccales bacterium]
MKFEAEFNETFAEHIRCWEKFNPEIVDKIGCLIDEVLISPFKGRGSPHAYTKFPKHYARRTRKFC